VQLPTHADGAALPAFARRTVQQSIDTPAGLAHSIKPAAARLDEGQAPCWNRPTDGRRLATALTKDEEIARDSHLLSRNLPNIHRFKKSSLSALSNKPF